MTKDVELDEVHPVRPDRSRTPQQMLDATGRVQYTDPWIVDKMPRGEGERDELIFFRLDRQVSDDELEKEYEKRGLKPAHPYSLGAFNEANPTLAYKYPNATHWKAREGWCFMMFGRMGSKRSVHVNHLSAFVYSDDLLFAGILK